MERKIIGASLLGIVILVVAAGLIVAELKLGHGFALMAGVILGAFGIYLSFVRAAVFAFADNGAGGN